MNQYNAHVDTDLVISVSMSLNISENEVLGFFDGVLEEMHKCDPNFTRKPYSKKTDSDGKIQEKVWILRGYYPGTGIFFRVTLIESKPYYSNDSMFFTKIVACYPTKKRSIPIDSKEVRTYIAENALLDAPIPRLELKPQRLFTPKGMKPFRLMKRK